MIKGLKIKLIVTFVLFCITSLPLFYYEDKPYKINYQEANKELFVPQLSFLNSTDKVVNYVDSIYAKLNHTSFDTSSYVRIVSGTIKCRFYHGISNYTLSENWILYLLAKGFWSHLSAIVNPEHILEYPEGLCSQQNIVFMEVLKKKGITTRSVGLGTEKGPGHFLSEVLYNSKWHLFDVDLEPNWEVTSFNHESLEVLLRNKQEFYKIYDGRIKTSIIDKIVTKVHYGVPNEFPAKNMLLFHQVTKALVYLLPIIFLLFFVYYYKKYKTAL